MPIDPNNDPNEIVSNTPAQPTAQQPTPYYAEGISTPPNGGEVSSVSTGTPADATSTPDDSQMVSNGPTNGPTTAPTAGPTATPAQPPIHPSVQKAGIIHEIAQALGGGPRFRTTIDPNSGTVTRTAVPLSGREIGLAIAMEALSGSLAGLGAKGTNATGQAAAAGLQQGQAIAQQRQQAQQQEDQQAQQGYENQQQSLAQKAQIYEINSRIALNTSEAEQKGADTIQKLADQNKGLIDAYNAAGVLQEQHVTQEELFAQLKDGTLNATSALGPIDGYRLLGDGRVEATHSIITSAQAKVPLDAATWNKYADAHVPGFPKLAPGTQLASNFTVSGLQLARANEQLNSFQLAQQRHDEVVDALAKSDNPKVQALAKEVPTIDSLLSDPRTGAGLANALQRYQKWVSHSPDVDLYESLQHMASPSKSDGKGGFEPNPDAPFAQQIAQAYGGMGVLQAYHDEVAPLGPIKNEGDAADMIASSEPGSRSYKYAQRWMRTYGQQQAQVAAAKAAAEQRVKQAASTSNNTDSVLTTPDALGFAPNVPGGLKEYNKRQNSFKKQTDEIAKTEGTYQQFHDALDSIQNGNFTGAQSVVSLFDAIGLSATPLAGKGFRVNQNTIAEHAHARGWEGALQQKLLQAKAGDVITPQQVKDYAQIAAQARHSQYVNLANEVHNAGLSADFVLPTGNGQKIDPGTAQIFLSLTGNDPQKAMKAATAKGWAIQ